MKIVRIAALAALVLVAAAVAGPAGRKPRRGRPAPRTPAGSPSTAPPPSRRRPTSPSCTSASSRRPGPPAPRSRPTPPHPAKLVAALKTAGVAAKDIQTQQASLEPVYNENSRAVTGFQATTSVSTVIRTLTRVAATIDAAVTAGANTVYGPVLTRSNPEALYKQALTAAVADARAKAQLLASASNVTLGKVTAVVESGSTPVDLKSEARAADGGGNSIEPGTQSIQATVTVTFAIG